MDLEVYADIITIPLTSDWWQVTIVMICINDSEL